MNLFAHIGSGMSRLILVQPEKCEVSTVLQKALDEATHFEATIAKLHAIPLDLKRKARNIRDSMQKAIDVHMKDSQSKWQVIIEQAQEQVQSEVDFLKFSNSQQRETIQRLDFEISRLMELTKRQRSEIVSLEARNTDLTQRVDALSENLQNAMQQDTTGSALRRQIAINIEYEVKKELLTALGEVDMAPSDILRAELFPLLREARR